MAVAAIAVLVVSCGDGAVEPTQPPAPVATTVTVNPGSAALTAVGETVRLTAEVRNQNGQVMAGAAVVWTTSDASVAAVDASGLVTAAANGNATITATAGSVSRTALVTVMQSVASVRVSPSAGTIALGDTLRLVARAGDANGHAVAEAEFAWASGDTAVAVVDTTGLVRGVRGGEATITVVSGGVEGTATVTVSVGSVTLDSGAASAPEGGMVTLALAVDPVPESAISVRYTLGADGDPITSDADALDYTDGGGGAIEIVAGASAAMIEIAINDDDEIEPAREVFVLTLDTPGPDAGYALGEVASASVTIDEGVCDRTPQVRDQIVQQAGVGDCVQVEDRHLASIRTLSLFDNRLTSLPERVFSGLPNLWNISLRRNELTELPAGIFAGLARLRVLDLSYNNLTALPEGVFSGLASLRELHLGGWNPGTPFTLTAQVARTDGGDPTSRGPATLGFSVAEGAPFGMTIPLSVRGGTLSHPDASFAAGATVGREVTLTPDGSGAGVSVAFGPIPIVCQHPESHTTGPICSGLEIVAGDPLVVANPETVALSISAAHLTQASQDLSRGIPLIAGRQALLRVFATADEHYAVGHEGHATFFVRGREVYSAPLELPASGIPVDLKEGRLGHSFNARIPGRVLQPGLEMVVELDPDRVLSLKAGSRSRFPASGRLALDVRALPPLNLAVVPVLYRTEGNRETNPVIEDVMRDMAGPDTYGLVGHLGMLPIGELNLRFREPYYTSADTEVAGHQQLLGEIDILRHLEAGADEHYHGIFFIHPHFRDWAGGFAQRPGYTGISGIWPNTGNLKNVFAHELGHNLSLWHAQCDRPRGHPAYTRYPDGSIGAWGHRFTDRDGTGLGRLLDPGLHTDVMGQDTCPDWRTGELKWISDRNFTRAFNHRLTLMSEQARFARRAAEQETLLLWGSVQEGDLRLEPAFAHSARLKLPGVPGPYWIEGRNAEGRRLFSFSFTPEALDHGGSSFLFAIPFESEWYGDLDRITLTGPEGSTALDRDTGGRAALIIDGVSGLVRTIARDWIDGGVASAASIAADAQVHVIRGLPRR